MILHSGNRSNRRSLRAWGRPVHCIFGSIRQASVWPTPAQSARVPSPARPQPRLGNQHFGPIFPLSPFLATHPKSRARNSFSCHTSTNKGLKVLCLPHVQDPVVKFFSNPSFSITLLRHFTLRSYRRGNPVAVKSSYPLAPVQGHP